MKLAFIVQRYGPDVLGTARWGGDLVGGHLSSHQLIAPLIFGVLIAPDWMPHLVKICV